MTGRTKAKDRGIKTEDALDFLRKSALVKETEQGHSLTSKGERFLQELQGPSSRSPGMSNLPDGSGLSEGTVGP
jgi:hypothetical protein